MKKYLILGAGIIAVLLIIVALPTPKEKNAVTPAPLAMVGEKNTIKTTETGFLPSELTIKKGETVTFINETDNPSWPASDIHPSHTLYPGSGIAKCQTEEKKNIFDACKGLAKGESWSFTFNEVGTWKLHDHLNPVLKGKIIVEDATMPVSENPTPTPTPPTTTPTPTPSPASTQSVKSFTIEAKNFSFFPREIKVKKGDQVKITLTNSNGMHDLVIDEFGKATPRIEAGGKADIEFTADKIGTFTYYCSVGSHRSMGMEGTLIVE